MPETDFAVFFSNMDKALSGKSLFHGELRRSCRRVCMLLSIGAGVFKKAKELDNAQKYGQPAQTSVHFISLRLLRHTKFRYQLFFSSFLKLFSNLVIVLTKFCSASSEYPNWTWAEYNFFFSTLTR